MSTIAYRDGIIAGDSQITSGTTSNGCSRKVRLCRVDGQPSAVVGVAGSFQVTTKFLDWFMAGASEKDKPTISEKADFAAVSVTADQHRAGLVTNWEDLLVPTVFSTDFEVLGTGSEVAIGAMAMGASAVDAVRVAREHDVYTGGPIWVADLVSGLYVMVR